MLKISSKNIQNVCYFCVLVKLRELELYPSTNKASILVSFAFIKSRTYWLGSLPLAKAVLVPADSTIYMAGLS